jgi:rhodanese-related sulfurtransferase
MSAHKTVGAWDAREDMEKHPDAVLVDVRTPVEFRATHAEGAVNVPLDTIGADSLKSIRNGHGDGPVYLICRTGSRAGMACEKLTQAGGENLHVVEGGTEAWEEAGLPVVHGKKAISLERQVRIVAGSMVVLGSVLAAFVHPWFWVVPAFVGSGLAFAGITDTCAMGMMLARMPWNRVTETT